MNRAGRAAATRWLLALVLFSGVSGCAEAPGEPPRAPQIPAPQTAPRHSDLIRVETPRAGDRVGDEIAVSGEARGPWFFEGDFPLLVIDSRGAIVARHHASARGPWMTSGWVPFAARIRLTRPFAQGWGWLVLQKDNPSDQRELDDEVRVPLYLTP